MMSAAIKHALEVAISQPTRFWKLLKRHMWILLPLIATQLLQKLQDLVDDRLMNTLGLPALTIHNVQGSLYSLSQEIGLIAATSLLIFWKRQESKGKQKNVLSLHLILTLFLSGLVCFFTYRNIPFLCNHFEIPVEYHHTAELYLKVGLFNIMLRALYVPVNTILITCNQRLKCIGCILSLVAFKSILAVICAKYIWNHEQSVDAVTIPMIVFLVGSCIGLLAMLIYATRHLFDLSDGWGKFNIRHALKVWPGEIGIGGVSALSPLLFSFQVAKANTSPGFFVTYQIALHLTYLLALPVLAGIQIAVSEASVEHSEYKGSSPGVQFKPLHKSNWWPKFFYASLVPSVLAFSIAALFPQKIITLIYGYDIPSEHLPFLPVFYGAWILFQCGSVFLIMLRASHKNIVATRNIIISGLCVQIGLTQLLLWLGVCTSLGVGLVIAASCFTYLLLNWNSAFNLQIKASLAVPIKKVTEIILPHGKRRKKASEAFPTFQEINAVNSPTLDQFGESVQSEQ